MTEDFSSETWRSKGTDRMFSSAEIILGNPESYTQKNIIRNKGKSRHYQVKENLENLLPENLTPQKNKQKTKQRNKDLKAL